MRRDGSHVRRRVLAGAVVLGGLVLVLLAIRGLAMEGRGPDAPRDGGRRWPGPPPSVVFGPEGAPTGGSITVGLFVPSAPSRRLVECVAPGVLAEFWAQEATRRSAEGAEATPDGPVRGVPSAERPEAIWAAAEREDALRRAYDRIARDVVRETGVEVAFVDVLAEDAGGVPLVLVDGAVRYAEDAAALRRAIARGTVVLRTSAEGEDVGEVDPKAVPKHRQEVDGAKRRCLEVVRASTAVRRLPHDPLEVVESHRDGDHVVVRYRERPSRVTLRTLEDREVATASIASDGTARLRCPDPALDAFTHRVVVEGGGPDGSRRAHTVADLVGVAERRLLSAATADLGAPFAPRLAVLNSKTGAPVPGVAVRLALRQGARLLDQVTVTTDAHGTTDRALEVPADASPGPAELLVDDERFAIVLRAGVMLSVVTERALYRADDEVFVRVMAHRASTGAPIRALEVRLRLDSIEKVVTTSEHGIASTSFHLVGAEAGRRTLVARAGEAAAETTFQVRAIELPTFTLAVEPAALRLRRGEQAPLRVAVSYVNGAPVVGAQVSLDGVATDVEVRPRRLVTDAEGRAEGTILVGAAARSAAQAVHVLAVDADGRRAVAWASIEVPQERRGAALSMHLLDEPVVGWPCRLALEGDGPGPVTVLLEGGATQRLDLPASGAATVEVTPVAASTVVRANRGDETVGVLGFEAAVRKAGRLLVVPSRRLFTVGERLTARVLGEDGPAFVELVRGSVPLRATSLRLAGGEATLDLELTAASAGVVTLRAWRLVDDVPTGSSVGLLVVRGRSLRVEARPGAPGVWRPGETASVDVSVTDREGRPTPAVLGYWGVDRALLALAPSTPGAEEVFDVVSAGCETSVLALDTELGRPVRLEPSRQALGAIHVEPDLASALPIRDRPSVRRREAAEAAAVALAEAAAARVRVAVLDAFRRMPLDEVRTASSLLRVVHELVRSGRLDAALLHDPWGTPFALGRILAEDEASWGSWYSWDRPASLPWRSAGPDLTLTTGDAMAGSWEGATAGELGGELGRLLVFLSQRAARRGIELPLGGGAFDVEGEVCFDLAFIGPVTNGLIGLGGGAGGSFRGRGGSRNLRAGAGGRALTETVHLRRDFSPTLCFVPEAIVGEDGRASLSIPLRDAVTTWDLRFVASDPQGAVGTTSASLRVTQPLHAEPWIAPHLTVGDELDLPVALRNETEQAVRVACRAVGSNELALVGAAHDELDVAPRGTGVARFRLRAVAPGRARVRIDASAPTGADAVERIVVVAPRARAQVETAHGTLSSDHPFLAALPPVPEALHTERRVSLYASPLADLVGGFEGLIACPHG